MAVKEIPMTPEDIEILKRMYLLIQNQQIILNALNGQMQFTQSEMLQRMKISSNVPPNITRKVEINLEKGMVEIEDTPQIVTASNLGAAEQIIKSKS